MTFRATIVWRPSVRLHEKTLLFLVQLKSIDMGLLIGDGVSLDAADDTGDAPYRPNVYVNDVPRDDSVAPEPWNA